MITEFETKHSNSEFKNMKEVITMNYEIVNLEEKTVVGLTARTSNEPTEVTAVVGGLWGKFLGEGLMDSIKNQANPYAIGLYTNYDFKEVSYDVTVGVAVTKNDDPELSAKTIPAGKYAVFNIKGHIVKDVAKAWEDIWAMTLDRSFTADFEEYLTNDEENADIRIYVALN